MKNVLSWGGHFAPDLPGHFAPDLSGQFRPDLPGHFVPFLPGHFRPTSPGQFCRFFQSAPQLTGYFHEYHHLYLRNKSSLKALI